MDWIFPTSAKGEWEAKWSKCALNINCCIVLNNWGCLPTTILVLLFFMWYIPVWSCYWLHNYKRRFEACVSVCVCVLPFWYLTLSPVVEVFQESFRFSPKSYCNWIPMQSHTTKHINKKSFCFWWQNFALFCLVIVLFYCYCTFI